MAGSNRRYTVAAIVLPFLLLAISGLSRANDIFVNTTDGDSDPAPLCTLADAVAAHNSETAVNGCAAGNGLDTIFFAVTGTITIDEPLEITNGILQIAGPTFGCSGAGPCGITISGGGSSQIVVADADTLVGLFFLTLRNGFANTFFGGGAISANGTFLEVDDCLLLNNTAEGPDAFDGGRGGALSQVSNGEVEIINSTFVGNSAVPGTSSGDGLGGAIYSTASSTTLLTVTNSTFSGNSATKGAVYHTMANHPELKGDILANSSGSKNCGALTPVDNGFNITDDNSCMFSGTSLKSTNPLLDPAGLKNNGGPTDTIALQAISPAINRITPLSNCTDQESPPLPLGTDQRLFGRPDPLNLNTCDSGAFEFGAVAPIVVNKEKVQIARSGPSSDQVNAAVTFTYNGDPDCDLGAGGDEDALRSGFGIALVEGTCASLPATGLFVTLDDFVVRTVNGQSYGTLFQMQPNVLLQQPNETVSARLVSVSTRACGEWTLNLQVAGLNTSALGLGGSNPFALLISDLNDAETCFDVTDAIVGAHIPPPPGGGTRRVRRGVRR